MVDIVTEGRAEEGEARVTMMMTTLSTEHDFRATHCQQGAIALMTIDSS